MEEIQNFDEDIEKAEKKKRAEDDSNRGLSESSKEDILVYITILLITILAAIVVAIKVVLFDVDSDKYSDFFMSKDEHETNQTSWSQETYSDEVHPQIYNSSEYMIL